MDFLEKYSPFRLLLVSLVSAVFILYPNITFFSMERDYLGEAKQTTHLLFFILGYLFFSILIWALIIYNLRKIKTPAFSKRLLHTFIITTISYLVYIGFSVLLSPKPEWFSGMHWNMSINYQMYSGISFRVTRKAW